MIAPPPSLVARLVLTLHNFDSQLFWNGLLWKWRRPGKNHFQRKLASQWWSAGWWGWTFRRARGALQHTKLCFIFVCVAKTEATWKVVGTFRNMALDYILCISEFQPKPHDHARFLTSTHYLNVGSIKPKIWWESFAAQYLISLLCLDPDETACSLQQ